MKMKNKGINQHRFSGNPLEKAFAEEWEELNTTYDGEQNGRCILDYLLSEDANHPCGEVTDRDREVAATVIQWLGSPVGLSFVMGVIDSGE